jgi:hypothetical protein
VQLNKAALEEEGVALDTPVSFSAHNLPLRSALKIVLSQYNLTYRYDDESIGITSLLEAYNHLETRLYVVNDLLSGDAAEREIYAAELREIIEQSVAPTTWCSVGGWAEVAVLVRQGTMLIRQTQAQHDEVESLLENLRAGKDPEPTAAELQILQALERPISCDLVNVEFNTACQLLARLASLPNIILNRPALEEEGISRDTPVTLRVHDLSLRSALQQLLSTYNLTILVANDVLHVTSQLEAGNELVHRLYPVADLLDEIANPDPLIELIEQSIAVNSWSCVGGAGTVQYFTPRRLLLLYQTEAVHQQIDWLLAALRGGSYICESNADARIFEALRQSVTIDVKQARLDSTVRQLARQVGIDNVFIDRPALEEEGVSLDTPVTFRGHNISLQSALRLMLRPFNIEAIADTRALRVSSSLQLGNELSVCIYPVADLIDTPPDSLIDLIHDSVAPETWDSVGGAGTVKYFARKRCLVINNTVAMHGEVAALLAQLRGGKTPALVAAERIHSSLRTIYDWDFAGGTIQELCDRLSVGLNCTAVLDQAGLEEEGVTPLQQIAVTARNQPLDEALTQALQTLGLTYAVQDQALIITSPSSGILNFDAKVYRHPSSGISMNGVTLASVIERQVSPGSWCSAGGEGRANYFPTTGHLVIYHDAVHHRQIQRFLEEHSAASPQ